MSDAHIIDNFDELATTDARTDALTILEAGYSAIETETVLRKHLSRKGSVLKVQERRYDLAEYERVFFIGIGKCAASAGCVIEEVLGEHLTDGIVVDIQGAVLSKLVCMVGTHPLPSRANVAAAQSVADMLEDATERDLVLTLISGGGSALLCLPNDMACEQIAEITQELMHAGASIDEMNTVRKHTSRIQGGYFAKLAHPARVVSLIFSDVPGNDMSVIASGPTVLDTTTQEDAERILAEYGVMDKCTLPHCELLETPKEEEYFSTVDNFLLLTNETALNRMKRMAEALGYTAEVKNVRLEGEAREVGEMLAQENMAQRSCFIYGGETTVTMTGQTGNGGRNQEVALGALLALSDGRLVLSAASDGCDNGSAAGALADMVLYTHSEDLRLDAKSHLENNTSYDFFDQAKGHIRTGSTGSNVSDFFIVLHS
jgi:glycerate-2-kinase